MAAPKVNLILSNQLFAADLAPLVIVFNAPELFQESFSEVKTRYLRKCVADYVRALSKKRRVVQVSSYRDLKRVCESRGIQALTAYDVNDVGIEIELRKVRPLTTLETPMFLNSRERNQNLLGGKLFFTSFYVSQRKHFGLLLKAGKPVGGRWTFDTENRRKMPEALAKKLTSKPKFPTTRTAALRTLKKFVKEKLPVFGEYQDYIDKDNILLYHSGLSAPLNVGLITPADVLAAIKGSRAPINSLEAFVRQIVGWREYMRGLYQVHHKTLRADNYFGHSRKIPRAFYEATTGIVPLDASIRRLKRYGYVHHIERLMIIGCLFMLCEVHPLEVMRWFTELSIDAFEWVMLSNVMAMSQFACGPFATTKPYVCASAYILRMSNYQRGPWCDIWDALFWRFIRKHRAFFRKQPRLSALTRNLESRATAETLRKAESFLRAL